jgi:fumarate hydratase subunit beta
MKRIQLPFTKEAIESLRAGDYLLLSGKILTARDAAHKKLVESIKKGEPLPFEWSASTIYYVGATPAKPGEPIGSCGPTSSYRMDPFVDLLMREGLRVMIGKGERSMTAKESIRRHGGLYLIVTGGIGAKVSKTVKTANLILYPDLGAEAVHELDVVDFPAIVAYDTMGGDLYEQSSL